MRLRSPIWWFGGKGNMVAKLLPLMPHHKTYVEVFGGGASLLFAKQPSEAEVYNDIDERLVNLFRVLQDVASFEKFNRLANLTLYSRSEYDLSKRYTDKVWNAYHFWKIARMSFSGKDSISWSHVTNSVCNNIILSNHKFFSMVTMLKLIAFRLSDVIIENNQWSEVLDKYDSANTFFYCDPPYVHETRSAGKYKYEMTTEEHKQLVQALLNIKGKAMLSCYFHEVYQPLINAGWSRIDFRTSCHVAGRVKFAGNTRIQQDKVIQGKGVATQKVPRIETLLMNY